MIWYADSSLNSICSRSSSAPHQSYGVTYISITLRAGFFSLYQPPRISIGGENHPGIRCSDGISEWVFLAYSYVIIYSGTAHGLSNYGGIPLAYFHRAPIILRGRN